MALEHSVKTTGLRAASGLGPASLQFLLLITAAPPGVFRKKASVIERRPTGPLAGATTKPQFDPVLGAWTPR